MNIMERQKVDIFSTCVFNNLTQLTLIFCPFFSSTLSTAESANYFILNNIDIWKIFAIHC